jgi:hypothetical protein
MSEIIGYIIATIILLAIAGGLNRCTNTTAQEKCEAKGGEFYKAVDASHSLCKLSQKEN